MKKRNIFLVLLILVLSSCQSKKATDLKTTLEQKDRTAFNVMVGKNGPSERKLKCLIDGDFNGALKALEEEEQAFNKIIDEINALQTDDIKHGNELKAAAANYYTAVKELELSERLNIAQQQISLNKSNPEKVRDAATHKQLQLSRDKLEMHKTVNKKEQRLAEAKKQFDLVNHLN